MTIINVLVYAAVVGYGIIERGSHFEFDLPARSRNVEIKCICISCKVSAREYDVPAVRCFPNRVIFGLPDVEIENGQILISIMDI